MKWQHPLAHTRSWHSAITSNLLISFVGQLPRLADSATDMMCPLGWTCVASTMLRLDRRTHRWVWGKRGRYSVTFLTGTHFLFELVNGVWVRWGSRNTHYRDTRFIKSRLIRLLQPKLLVKSWLFCTRNFPCLVSFRCMFGDGGEVWAKNILRRFIGDQTQFGSSMNS